MENTNLSKHTVSFGLSLVLASVINGLLVIAKESSPAVQAGMQKMTGHHWITHSIIVVAIFAVGGWLFGRANGGQGVQMSATRLLSILVRGVIISGLLIVGFYLIGD